MILQITKEYAERENVINWIFSYCKRNKINYSVVEIPVYNRYGETTEEIELVFKSENQLNCFVKNGNRNFPYFEFL